MRQRKESDVKKNTENKIEKKKKKKKKKKKRREKYPEIAEYGQKSKKV